jgi:hypothetical protein
VGEGVKRTEGVAAGMSILVATPSRGQRRLKI